MRVIIIDDEPNAREKLAYLIALFCPGLRIEAVCKNASEGIEAIRKFNPDLIFLDVEMPLMNGFDMLRALGEVNFEVIFTTANDQYAIKAIKYSALDYLLKPIDGEQLTGAVEKAIRKCGNSSRIQTLIENTKYPENNFKHLAIPTMEGFLFIKPDEVIRMEADGRYTMIYLENKEKILASKNLGEFEEIVSENQFLRIHHSHIVNLSHIRKYLRGDGGKVVMSDASVIDVSRRKKEEVLEKLLSGK